MNFNYLIELIVENRKKELNQNLDLETAEQLAAQGFIKFKNYNKTGAILPTEEAFRYYLEFINPDPKIYQALLKDKYRY